MNMCIDLGGKLTSCIAVIASGRDMEDVMNDAPSNPTPVARTGIARIKAQYLVGRPDDMKPLPDDDAAESGVATQMSHQGALEHERDDNSADLAEGSERPAKKPKLSGAQRKRLAKEEKAKRKGMNTGRKFVRVQDDIQLCWKAAVGDHCGLGDNHDITSYLNIKPRDIYFPPVASLRTQTPFVERSLTTIPQDFPSLDTLDPSTTCPLFSEAGFCNQGYKCRFLGAHIRSEGGKSVALIVDEQRKEEMKSRVSEANVMPMEKIKMTRSRKYPTPVTDAYLTELSRQSQTDEQEPEDYEASVNTQSTQVLCADAPVEPSEPSQETPLDDTPDVPMRTQEKKRLHWKGLTYLAPLTTVGNLPFRRLCAEYGADITCGEMALATSLLSGNRDEWQAATNILSPKYLNLPQIAGNKPAPLARIAEMLGNELGPAGRGLGALGLGNGLDFVDLNCGCPIDLVFKSGAGSARE
ncbi:tRNA-dihydrouridine synthase 3 [Tulasnella sp. 403]|nr:tRNA-dihydrouridine synthase 3 [Tulasnella sp. 403]